ncbi:MAG: Holliday junction resolvase RuvX [Clostridia bacterium]|nr:Holliday junction resolvase RuvX [Clostridia bacterium]
MVIMAVDLGDARTGIAVSDSGESFAFPKGVIYERKKERLIEKLVNAAKENSAELIVVGLPKNMDGSEGFRAQECTQTAELLAAATNLPVKMWDERCTTVLAHNTLNYTNTRGQKRKQTVDAVAATLILESFLAARKNNKD